MTERAERKRTRVCGKCRYSTGTSSVINQVQLFQCRRRAPSPGEGKLAASVIHRVAWPIVAADEWCGEYAEN